MADSQAVDLTGSGHLALAPGHRADSLLAARLVAIGFSFQPDLIFDRIGYQSKFTFFIRECGIKKVPGPHAPGEYSKGVGTASQAEEQHMTLTRADLVQHIMNTQNLDERFAVQIVKQFFESIAATLERGEEINISGFGRFDLKVKNARPGRNPKTLEEHMISKRRVTTFRAGPKLKQMLLSDEEKEKDSD